MILGGNEGNMCGRKKGGEREEKEDGGNGGMWSVSEGMWRGE